MLAQKFSAEIMAKVAEADRRGLVQEPKDKEVKLYAFDSTWYIIAFELTREPSHNIALFLFFDRQYTVLSEAV